MADNKKRVSKGGPLVPPALFPSLSWKTGVWILVGLFLLFFHRLLFGMNFLWEDIIEQAYPNLLFTMKSLGQGELPYWNSFVFGGMPFLADMQTTLFYPPAWLLYCVQTFTEPGGIAYVWFIIGHILVFGIGIFLLAKNFNLSETAALFAAVSLMCCGYVANHIIHFVFLYVIAWLPYSFLFLKKALETGRTRPLAAAILFFALSILGGYAQYVLFNITLLSVYTAFHLLSQRKEGRRVMIRTILFFALFCLLSMGLAAIQLFTTAELSAESVRTKMTWENSTVGSLSPSNLLTFLAPKFYGWITGIMEMDRASGTFTNGSPFWGGEGGHLFWETTLFIGITPLLLMITAFSGLRKNKLFLLWMGLGLFFLLAAFGKNGPVYPLLFKLPGFNLFRHPGRFAFIFSFSFILAAALSLDYLAGLIRNPNPALLSTTKRALYIGSGILGLLLLLSLTTLSGLDAAKAEAARQAVLWGLFAIIIIALLIGLLLKTGRPSAAYGLIAFTFLELFLFGYRFGCGKQTGQEAYPSDTRLDAIRAEIAQNPYRLQGRIFEGPGKGVRLFPHLNMGMVYEIPLVEGYNQLHLQRLSRFVHEVDPQKEMALLNVRYRAHPSGQGFIVALPDSFCARFSLRSTLITADSGGEAIQFINSPSFDPLRQAIIESKPSLVFDSSLLPEQLGTVRIRTYSANEITLFVQAAANALLFASEVWYPAWHAEVDGKKVPILRTNYLFRGVELTKGEHQVRFYYHSDAMRKGMWVTLISLLLVAGLWVGFSGFHNIATQK